MGLKARVDEDLKTALLGGNRFKGEVLRGLKATILNEEVAQGKRDEGLEDAVIEQLIMREVKKRHESAELYKQANRPELTDSELKEAEILIEYLPEQVTEAEVSATIDNVISELKASDMSSMGQVIGAVKVKLGNSAEGSLIAKLVKEKLI